MYIFQNILHNSTGDKMNIDIRENVIEKISNDDVKGIIDTINEAIITDDELVLPGLGVMIKLFWNDLDQNDKEKIAGFIKKKINK